MRFWKSLFSAVLAALILTACAGPAKEETAAPEPAPPDALTFTDALGYEATIESWNRVVSLYGSFAETWLLAGGTLAGTTSDIQRRVLIDGEGEDVALELTEVEE